jgi:succinoglycan biosynthesis transport protein ExoP
MNMPSSLPPSLTHDAMGGLSQRFGTFARDAAPTLGAYVNSIRARKWLVMALTLLITVLAAFLVNLITPIYRSSATLLIENANNKVVSFEELYGVPAGSREFFQTQAEFMQSREVGMRVVNRMNLRENMYFDPRKPKPGLLGKLRNKLGELGVSAGAAPERELTGEEVTELVLARYKESLEIVPVRRSQLVEIRFEAPDPFLAAQVANQTAESYITADLDARFRMQQTASKWLNEKLEDMRKELDTSERALQAFREEVGLVSTPASSMGGNIRSLDTSAEKLIAARVERAQAEQTYRQVSRNSANRYEVPAVFNNLAVQAARAQEAVAERRLADAAGALGPSHPEYKAALTDLNSARENTRKQAEGVIASIAKQYEVARSTERALEQAVAASKGDIRDINRKEGQLNVLERDVATNQQIYQTFLARVKETDATADFRNPIARVVDAAVPALEPVKPQKPQIILFAALLGGILACVVAISLEKKAAVIRSTDEVLDALGAPLLVAVPKVQGKQLGMLARLQHEEPNALFSEAIRSAATGVRLSLMNVPKQVIGFTSTLPGEGKSTLALSYAVEQARTRRTVLIDADMRKPSIGPLLRLPSDRMGLSELFLGAPVKSCVQHVAELNLHVITAGERVKNPHDLLMSARFTEILLELKNHYDAVIIDTPPLELVSDALPVGLQTTGMIYVVKGGETLIPMARRGLERLQAANIRTLGIILNAHDFERAGKYYGEYSAYGTYGKGYYGDDAGKA